MESQKKIKNESLKYNITVYYFWKWVHIAHSKHILVPQYQIFSFEKTIPCHLVLTAVVTRIQETMRI